MKKKIMIGLATLLGFTSCTKDDTDLALNVNVNPAHIVGMSGDTILVKSIEGIEFQLSGEADIVNFYSGEASHKYEFRDRIISEGTPSLSFSVAPNRLKVEHDIQILASTDFSGKYDSLRVKQATWQDLTPQEMKDYKNNATAKMMPSINLSSYGGGKAVFLAYRLTIKSDARFVAPTISDFLLVNNQKDGEVSTIVNGISNGGFSYVTISDNEIWKASGSGNAFWKLSGQTITVNSKPFDAANLGIDYSKDELSHELWAITKTLYLDKASPDTGKTIKDIQNRLKNYTHEYAKKGAYKVTFVGLSTGESGVKKVITKDLLIKITD